MSNVTIKLLDSTKIGNMFFAKDQVSEAKDSLKQGMYRNAGSFFFDTEGEAAAEEAFDMTNNPARQYERSKYYGNGPSVSVGDIVEVDGVNYLCASFGWKVLA